MSVDKASQAVTSALVAESPQRVDAMDGKDTYAPDISELTLGDVVKIEKRGRG
jgi:hypothetical protein